MNIRLDGKTAVVSASTAGIGYAIASGLAAAGAMVVINGRTEKRVDAALQKLKTDVPGCSATGMAADLSDETATERFLARYPHADILINNLGIFEPKSFFDIPDEDWTRFFRVNVLSGVRLSRHYAPGMVKNKWGRIQFISSESGIATPVEMPHYGMTKTAQLAVSRGLAETLAGTGVTVNSVLPGPTASEGVGTFVDQMAKASSKTTAEVEKDFFEHVRPSSLIKRFATVDEVANLCVYLASDQASATTGSALRVDGGVVRSIL
jgi:NAD(P)-dependent dehydrogenase (short-subunit alcohol dehydrogenase family)